MANPTLLATATVSGANAATRITAAQTTPTARVAANFLQIQALSTNGASVFIGDSTVQSSTLKGIELVAGATIRVAPMTEPNALNLADWYFASTSATAKVSCLYLEG